MADEAHLFALEKGEQHRLGDGIVAVGLFEDLDGGLARDIAEDDGIRFEFRGRTAESDVAHAGLEVDGQGVAHDGEALIVDGKRGFRGQSRGCQGEEKSEFFHGCME